MFDYVKSMSTGQKIYWGSLALATIGGGAYAVKIGAGDLVQFVDDNKMLVGAAAALGSLAVTLPILAKAESMLPQFMKLPAYGAIHMNGLHMGALAMQKNPLVVRNPLAFGALHVGGAHATHGVHHAMNGMHVM